MTPLNVLAWLDEVNRKKAPDTQRANIVAFERLQSWAVEHELIKKPVTTKKIENPTGRQRERIPTAEEITSILAQTSQEFCSIYQALRRSGARPKELCRATTKDYNRRMQVIVLKDHKTAKNTGKPRIIVVGRQLAELIDQSLASRTTGHLFLSPAGKPWTPQNLSRTFRQLRDGAGIPKDLVLYLTRHEAITRVCRKSGIRNAQHFAEHSDIGTTQRYDHVETEEIRRVQEELFDDD